MRLLKKIITKKTTTKEITTEDKVEKYFEKPAKFSKKEQVKFSDHLIKNEELDIKTAGTVTAGISYAIKTNTQVQKINFRTLCMAFTTLNTCLEKFDKLSDVWKEAGKKYYEEWCRRIGSAGDNPTAKDLKDKGLLQDEDNLKEFGTPNSGTVNLYVDRLDDLGISKTKSKEEIFKFYEKVQNNNNK